MGSINPDAWVRSSPGVSQGLQVSPFCCAAGTLIVYYSPIVRSPRIMRDVTACDLYAGIYFYQAMIGGYVFNTAFSMIPD